MLQKLNIVFICIFLFLTACKKDETSVRYEVFTIDENINVHKTIFLNDSVGFACGGTQSEYGAVFKTVDQGNNWKKVYSSDKWSIYDLHFLNDSIGYACGDTILLLTTHNGGENWQRYWFQQTPFHVMQRTALKKFFFINEKEFYIVGGQKFDAGLIYKTIDAGNSWKFDTYKNELKGIYCPDSMNVFVSGYGVIYKSTDRGTNYSLTGIKGDFYTAIHFNDKNNGIAIGYNGGIYKTRDAGEKWETVVMPNKVFEKRIHFNDMVFESNSRGYVIGTNGLLMFTDDGGSNWKLAEKFCEDNLFSVTLFKNNILMISGEHGKIYKVSF